MSRYVELDDQILALLRVQPLGYLAISDRLQTGWRVVDRRLQALRKRGLIQPDRKTKTWRIAE